MRRSIRPDPVREWANHLELGVRQSDPDQYWQVALRTPRLVQFVKRHLQFAGRAPGEIAWLMAHPPGPIQFWVSLISPARPPGPRTPSGELFGNLTDKPYRQGRFTRGRSRP